MRPQIQRDTGELICFKDTSKKQVYFLYDRIALIGKLRINMSSSKYAKIDFALKSFLEFR